MPGGRAPAGRRTSPRSPWATNERWAGGASGPADPRPAAGEGSAGRWALAHSRPAAKSRRRCSRRTLLTGAASPASCRRRRSRRHLPAELPGTARAPGLAPPPNSSSGSDRKHDLIIVLARAQHPHPPPPRFPPSHAGRLIPRYTAGFRGETARAARLAPRAGGGRVLPQQRSPYLAGGSPYSEDTRRLLSFVLSPELLGAAQPITTQPPLFPPACGPQSSPTFRGLHPPSLHYPPPTPATSTGALWKSHTTRPLAGD
ncbi:serine/threonine-protein kinase 35-like [Nannospalax galili]|uniref:serine/threonine-protein kinase 35-like n=1 Tax=Nannospalax galili TaxID=1026970 RepID=UPI00111C2257|nr:serine/threonine-protein kinase 35-like [Nannospalax galili]